VPRFSYIAKSLKGQPKQGVIEAKNEREVAVILRKEGYILISAKAKEKETKKIKINISIPFLGGVSLVDKIMFSRNLKVMISAGISLPRSLNILAEQSKNEKLTKALLKIADEITKGKNFSDTLSQYPDIFPEIFISMVKVGEEAGTLEDVLGVLTRQMEGEHELKSKIKGAMIYPAVIIGAMIIIGILMLVLVVPKLAETFDDLGVDLPFTTKLVIGLGTFFANFWYLIPLIIVVIFFLIKGVLKTESGKKVIDALVLRVPIVSPIIKKTNSAYTARTLSSLIASGVPIVRSLEIVSEVLGNIYYKKAIANVAEEVRKGSKMAEALKKYKDIYPILVIQMIAVGEETGETSEILGKLAVFFEDEVARVTQNMSSIVEPVLMLIIGAVVGFFAISMVQPIYSMVGSM